MLRLICRFHHAEEGHARTAAMSLVPAAGIILLAIGAANGTDWLTITGGIAAALGFVAMHVARHQQIDWDIYRRLEELEKK